MREGRRRESGSRRKIAESFLLFRRKVSPCWLDDNEPRKVRKRTRRAGRLRAKFKSGTTPARCYDVRRLLRWNFLSSNPLNPRKPSFLIARAQVSSLSFALAVCAGRKLGKPPSDCKNMQLSLHRAADEKKKRQKSISQPVESLRNFIRIVRTSVHGVTKKSTSLIEAYGTRDICVIGERSKERTDLKRDGICEIKIPNRRQVSTCRISLVGFYCDFPITSYIAYCGKNRNLFGVRLLKLLAARDLLTLSIAECLARVSVGNVSLAFVSRP